MNYVLCMQLEVASTDEKLNKANEHNLELIKVL